MKLVPKNSPLNSLSADSHMVKPEVAVLSLPV